MKKALETIDRAADRAQAAHRQYHQALRLSLAEALDSGRAHEPIARRDLGEYAGRARVHAAERLSSDSDLSDAVWDAMQQAFEDAGMRPSNTAMPALLDVAGNYLDLTTSAIADTLRLDESVVVGALTRLQLRTALHIARGIHPRVAMNMVKGGALANLHFGRTDRSGTHWNTTVYTRTLVRHLLVTAYNEAYLVALLSNGIDRAWVTNEDGKRFDFEILGQAGHTWETLRDKLMHPNTQQLVRH